MTPAFARDDASVADGHVLDGPTIVQAFARRVEISGSAIAFPATDCAPDVSWDSYGRHVRDAARALAALGVRRGDSVALLLNARREFHWLDLAIARLGAISVSLYATHPVAMLRYLIADAGARVLLTERAFVAQALELAGDVDHLFLVDGESAGVPGWDEALGGRDPALDDHAAVGPEDTAIVIYTSGTTGPPKGVALSHANLMFLVRALHERLRVEAGTQNLSYLPMAHMMARVADHYMAIAVESSVTHCPNPREIAAHLPAVRPSWFTSTPRLFEKLRAALLARIEREPDVAHRKELEAALEIGLRKVRAEQQFNRGGPAPAPSLLADGAAVESHLRALRAHVGLDRFRSGLIGGAPVPLALIEFWHALGVPLSEAYGLTEASAATTVNPPGRARFGTVGTPLPDVAVKLATDGEVLVKGPGVMKGYLNQPDATAAAFDEEGWLRTGDLGALDGDGYLRIVGRKKEIIINAAGKNISPAYIESHLLAASPLIATAVAIGDARPYIVALLTLERAELEHFATAHGLPHNDPAGLVNAPAVRDEIVRAVARANDNLSRVEQIKTFRILPAPWVPGGDELTATMKLKRSVITEKYQHQIDDLYPPRETNP